MLTWISLVLLGFSFYVYLRQVGILYFMPSNVNNLLTQVSFFDILVQIIIHRNLSKLIGNIVTPFLTAHTAEEAKNILKTEAKLPDYIYKGLFQKVSKVSNNVGSYELFA